jgi:hypothetical protein
MLDDVLPVDGDTPSPAERRAAFRAGWDARLLPMLSLEWQSADELAERIGEAQPTVLARLKDMSVRQLAEHRVVKYNPKKRKPGAKRPRVHTARFEAQFRLAQTSLSESQPA